MSGSLFYIHEHAHDKSHHHQTTTDLIVWADDCMKRRKRGIDVSLTTSGSYDANIRPRITMFITCSVFSISITMAHRNRDPCHVWRGRMHKAAEDDHPIGKSYCTHQDTAHFKGRSLLQSRDCWCWMFGKQLCLLVEFTVERADVFSALLTFTSIDDTIFTHPIPMARSGASMWPSSWRHAPFCLWWEKREACHRRDGQWHYLYNRQDDSYSTILLGRNPEINQTGGTIKRGEIARTCEPLSASDVDLFFSRETTPPQWLAINRNVLPLF